MTGSTATVHEERHAVATTELYLLRAGTGHPLLVLHGVEGTKAGYHFMTPWRLTPASMPQPIRGLRRRRVLTG